MNHDTEREPHDAGRDVACKYENQLGNKIYLCKVCIKYLPTHTPPTKTTTTTTKTNNEEQQHNNNNNKNQQRRTTAQQQQQNQKQQQ